MYTESSFYLFMHSKLIQKLTEIIRVERRVGLSKYLLFTSEQTVIFCSSCHLCHLCNVNFSFEQKLIGLVSLSFDIFCFHATSCMCKKNWVGTWGSFSRRGGNLKSTFANENLLPGISQVYFSLLANLFRG